MKETTFQYSYIKAKKHAQYSGFQVFSGHLEFKHHCNKFNIATEGTQLMSKNVIKSSLIYL